MTEAARFTFSLSDGRLEIVGTELFVSQQVEAFRDVILDAFRQSNVSPVLVHRISEGQRSETFEESSNVSAEVEPARNPFPRVLDVLNEKIKVTKSIRGSTTAEKSIRLILIYLWGKERLLGQSTAEFRELRDLCEQ